MNLLMARFDLSYRQGKVLEDRLEAIEDPDRLSDLVILAAQVESVEAFLDQLPPWDKALS